VRRPVGASCRWPAPHHLLSPHMTDSNVTTAATTKRPATSDDRSMVMMLGKREGLRGTGDKKVIGSATRYSCSSG
jgi:hypothetical protein